MLFGALVSRATAEDPADTFFREGVWGAPPLLLPTPELAVSFYRLDAISYGAEEMAALSKRAHDLAFPGSLYSKFVSFKKAKFAFTVDARLQVFNPRDLGNNRLAVIFADIEKDEKALYAANQQAYQNVLSREPDLNVETHSVYDRCGLYIFRNKSSALAAILVIPPNEKREIAHYCITYSLLESAGFRGRVESLPQGICVSVRCSQRPKLILTDWDASALGALYGVATPTYDATYRHFREVLQKQP
ncbi:hypothetical protein [Dongia rigui]|uniref:Uncharacterized protein n=1 Tax=Dongia rigui TaxID=940149 RepID=A0ABU5DV27_9PROT|nr:hypothetical protein [Dongia rigui]MDY0871149.1 hypothetical protein [Dongia rigui]